MSESVSSALPDLSVMAVLTLVALVAVWVPFVRGIRLCFEAWRATERLSPAQLSQKSAAKKVEGEAEPLSLLMMRVLRKSMRQNDASDHYPSDFVFDAARQYVMHEYASHYAGLISMYASLLPPIGFVGTTGGMLILFLSMHLGDSALELGALAVALTSSVFALVAFSVLEGLKVRLYRRLLVCLSDVQGLFDQAEEKRLSSTQG
jgi:biopolymer transport protein ExbB/TolQ